MPQVGSTLTRTWRSRNLLGARTSNRARALYDLYADPSKGAVFGSYVDNTLYIKDPVTPANDFDGKLWNETTGLYTKLVESRAGSAWDSDGGVFRTFTANQARYGNNPDGARGGKIETQRTNLLLQSGDLSNAQWTKTNATVAASAEQAPTGSAAWLLTETTATGDHRAFNFATVASSTAYVTYCFVKFVDCQYVALQETVLGSAVFDLINGTVFSGANGRIYPAGNGWYLIALVGFTTGGAQTTWVTQLRLASPDGSQFSYTGTSRSLLFGGGQLEAGAWPGTYIPTAAAAVTRQADGPTLAATAFNLTANGTLYVDCDFDGGTAINPNGRTALALDDGTGNERHLVYNGGGTASAFTADGGVQQAFLQDLAVAHAVRTRLAYSFAPGDYAFVQDGRTPVIGSGALLPAPNTLRIGRHIGATQINGRVYDWGFIGA